MIEEKTYMELAEEYTDSWFEGSDCESEPISLARIEDQVEQWIALQED